MPAYLTRDARVIGKGKSSCSGALESIRTWTSLPTNTPAFASTVDSEGSDHRLGVDEDAEAERGGADQQHGQLRQARQAMERQVGDG